MSANNNLEGNLSNSDKHWSEWIPVYGAYRFGSRLYKSKSWESLPEREGREQRKEIVIMAYYHGYTSMAVILPPVIYLIDKLGK